MKKVLAMVLAVAIMAACFVSCNTQEESSGMSGVNVTTGKDSGEIYKIGILGRANTTEKEAAAQYYAEKACKDSSSKVTYQMLLGEDATDMTAKLQQLSDWGAQGILLLSRWSNMDYPVQTAIDEGAVVAVFDAEAAENSFRILGDDEQAGALAAQAILEKVGENGTVVVLNAPLEMDTSVQREKGFADYMATEAPNLKIQTYSTSFTRNDGAIDFTQALDRLETIDAVYAMDDEVAIGVLNAMSQQGRTEIQMVVGGGGSQEFLGLIENRKDVELATVNCGYHAAQGAIKELRLILSGATSSPQRKTAGTLITRENCGDFIDAIAPY